MAPGAILLGEYVLVMRVLLEGRWRATHTLRDPGKEADKEPI